MSLRETECTCHGDHDPTTCALLNGRCRVRVTPRRVCGDILPCDVHGDAPDVDQRIFGHSKLSVLTELFEKDAAAQEHLRKYFADRYRERYR